MIAVPLILKGLLLGWSVAWPPGPINAEMMRRGLSRGFWPAFSVGAGASSGDFLWAVLVSLGAGTIVNVAGVRTALGILSLALLLALAFLFLKGAWHGWKTRHAPAPPAERKAFEGSRGGFFLGMGLALSSPWNVAFWLAVIGQQSESTTLAASIVLALAVITGAMTWCLVFNIALRAGARFATPMWEILTNAATGALMIGFALRLGLRLAA